MRAREVTAIRIVRIDTAHSVMELRSSDGTSTSVRRWEAPNATILHAARCIADHYGLVRSADGYRSAQRTPDLAVPA